MGALAVEEVRASGKVGGSSAPRPLTSSQAARILGVSRKTVWNLAREGVLHPLPLWTEWRRYDFYEVLMVGRRFTFKQGRPRAAA